MPGKKKRTHVILFFWTGLGLDQKIYSKKCKIKVGKNNYNNKHYLVYVLKLSTCTSFTLYMYSISSQLGLENVNTLFHNGLICPVIVLSNSKLYIFFKSNWTGQIARVIGCRPGVSLVVRNGAPNTSPLRCCSTPPTDSHIHVSYWTLAKRTTLIFKQHGSVRYGSLPIALEHTLSQLSRIPGASHCVLYK